MPPLHHTLPSDFSIRQPLLNLPRPPGQRERPVADSGKWEAKPIKLPFKLTRLLANRGSHTKQGLRKERGTVARLSGPCGMIPYSGLAAEGRAADGNDSIQGLELAIAGTITGLIFKQLVGCRREETREKESLNVLVAEMLMRWGSCACVYLRNNETDQDTKLTKASAARQEARHNDETCSCCSEGLAPRDDSRLMR
ncbi:hypothetical protein E2C01_015686 [Portunus trituberculatus]|uniref:Uncharacterized protein n=1 Tax=Portunus trituberculatus TaxID=210409 RepID=A0A5B7DNA5_PORTR|nr:hypothetical protein [Portunus trituberculatus]